MQRETVKMLRSHECDKCFSEKQNNDLPHQTSSIVPPHPVYHFPVYIMIFIYTEPYFMSFDENNV